MAEIKILKNIMDENLSQAAKNRQWFRSRKILVLNLIASPGAGKTTFLEQTIKGLTPNFKLAAIEGDITGDHDAKRIEALGVPVVQINTEGGCHLDAHMIDSVLSSLDLSGLNFLFIENVGNLVCPAEFDLGEDLKVVVLSTPEGHDKPAKYPLIFSEAQAVIINKIDLLQAVDFDLIIAERDIRRLNPNVPIFRLSCKTGEGLDKWLQWLETQGTDNG
ncbi:hydrogenase nickel incorporation protein HypB [candidate division TA06 bacterium]|uniref:Hydrogenase nickel incorporation protein HypB n=1 Tax=candidate division TA06 bacterium TaxID=2250710 RepID=A0A933I9B8_UNCT6|nr:hydrogenase nickel incorporation protein HypB [candidate division TA06 bacterium]